MSVKHKLIEMKFNDILRITHHDVDYDSFGEEEILHIFRECGGLWLYDYEAAGKGKFGMHALLKSGLHSEGFLNSKVVLCYPNIREIIAKKLADVWKSFAKPPAMVCGIPDGATELAADVAKFLGCRLIRMAKQNGMMSVVTEIGRGDLLLVEDFCTRGTGLREAVGVIHRANLETDIIPYELAIINRGGLPEIHVPGCDRPFRIKAISDHTIRDWEAGRKTCPLCRIGSEPIKPKETEKNWGLLCSSQR